MRPDPAYCRDASLARREPLHGTASTARRWILVEQRGPWGPHALRRNRLGEEASARLRALGRAVGARVLLIRRHGHYVQRGHRLFAAFTGRRRRWLEELAFEDVDALLSHDFSPLTHGRSVGGARVDELRFFVCTHGRHDPCCARHGRPVAAALDAARPKATWETSHIGGDRFAANVLILPLGVYYGRVDAGEAARLMEGLGRGELDLAHFRGRTCDPFDAQAAEWLVRDARRWLRLDDLVLEHHEPAVDGRSRTRFRGPGGRSVTADLEVTRAPATRLTCHASRAARPPRYRLLAIRQS